METLTLVLRIALMGRSARQALAACVTLVDAGMGTAHLAIAIPTQAMFRQVEGTLAIGGIDPREIWTLVREAEALPIR